MLYDSVIAYQLATPPAVEVASDTGEWDGLTYEKELIYVGDFEDKTRKLKFSVDESLVDHWLRTHDEMVKNGIDVPTPKGHTDDVESNRGKVIRVTKRLNEEGLPALFGVFKFRDKEAAKLAASANVSIYVPPEFTDGKGRRYVRPIRHVAFTDYPVIPGLGKFHAIAASLVLDQPRDDIGRFGEGSGDSKRETPKGMEGIASLAGRINEGAYVDKSTINGLKDPEVKLAKAIVFFDEALSDRGLTLVQKTGSSIVQSSRGGAKTGAGVKGWYVRKKEISAKLSHLPQGKSKMSLASLAEKLGVQVADKEEVEIEVAIAAKFADVAKEVETLKTKLKGKEPPAAGEGDGEKDGEKPPLKIAASLRSMLADNRKMKIRALQEQGKITAAVAKDLEEEHCADDAVALALSYEGDQPNTSFDKLVATLNKNSKIAGFSEKTSGQSIELSHTRLDPKDNPLVANAEKRAKERAGAH